MLLKRKVDIETAKADIEGVNSMKVSNLYISKLPKTNLRTDILPNPTAVFALFLHYNGARKYRRTRHTSVNSNGLYAKFRQ